MDDKLKAWCWNDNKTAIKRRQIQFQLSEITPYKDYSIFGGAFFRLISPKQIKTIEITWNVVNAPYGNGVTKTIFEKGAHSFKQKKVVVDGEEKFVITGLLRPVYRLYGDHSGYKPLLYIKKMDILFQDGEKQTYDSQIVSYSRPDTQDVQAAEGREKNWRILSIVLIAVIGIIILMVSILNSNSSKNKNETGYYDKHGGYHETKDERDHWNKTYDWMDENW